jgi:AraC family transcriptional regulator of adaptative response / DNA-3-methyladenine glycosylase II
VELQLSARAPFDLGGELAFLAARAVPGVEAWDGERYHRALDLPHGHGVAAVGPPSGASGRRPGLVVDLRLEDDRDVDAAVTRLSHLFDLDADPRAVDESLAADDVLRPLVRTNPGRRVPGTVDPFETAVRAVIGQQVSVAGARTVAGRIVAACATPLRIDGGPLTHVFPTPAQLMAADRSVFPMPAARARTIVELSARVDDGRLRLARNGDRDELRRALHDVPGIGPWTAGYIAMRGLGDPDVFLPTDLGVKVGLAALGIGPERAERWRPWRSYALHHLWAVSAARWKEVS